MSWHVTKQTFVLFLADTFWTNPQYRVNVVDADDDDDDDAGTVLIGLMQKGRRQMRKEGQDLMTIGYVIYRVSAAGLGGIYDGSGRGIYNGRGWGDL